MTDTAAAINSPGRHAAAPDPQPVLPERADAAAWLAVVAGTLGSLMALLDISIVNSSLPTIQGEIGASGTEGTWVATAYLVAETIVIPLSGWLQRVLGLRTLLLAVVILFTGFSIMCGLATTLPMMIVGRVGQGLTGGALIPTGQTIIATRLPRHQQPIGISVYGMTAIMGPVLGPVIGGWLTENVSWHYAFFINLPVGAVLVTLLLVAMPHQRARLDLIREADWRGIAGLVLGLGALTVVLEEGEREQWFSSPTILRLAIVSAFGFVLLFWGQATAQRPVIRLKLLLDRQFGSVVVMVIAVGMALYGTSYAIPQFLATIAGYNALQAGEIVLLAGLPSFVIVAFAPLLLRHLDLRVAVGFGLTALAFSAYLETGLTSLSTGGSFVNSQLLRGVGTIFAMLFLNQAAVQSVPREMAGDASGLYNAARNLGGSFALAGISIVQDQRLYFHSRRLEETLGANAPDLQTYIAGQAQALGGTDAAMRALSGTIQTQALTMTYSDLFWLLSVGILAVTPLVLFLRPLERNAKPAAMH